jgi:peptidoglycan/xylan/chitin deacetylase (PgdA/CDA1 family)
MVIALHRVTDVNFPAKEPLLNNFIEITNRKLEDTIVNLQKLNVQFISLEALQQCLQENKPEKPLVHISFDDGYLDNFKLAYPVLKKYKIPFSIFVASDFINNDHPFLWWYIIESIIKNEREISFTKYNFSITGPDYKTKFKSQIFNQFRSFMMEYLDTDRSYFENQLNDYVKDIPQYSIPKTLDWSELNLMLTSGLCELGVHTTSHARFKYLSYLQNVKEIMNCKQAITLHTGISPKYFSYPYGAKEDIGDLDKLQSLYSECGINLAFTTIPDELNHLTNPFLVPRLFINNSVTMYTLKTRLTGSYQRNNLKELS